MAPHSFLRKLKASVQLLAPAACGATTTPGTTHLSPSQTQQNAQGAPQQPPVSSVVVPVVVVSGGPTQSPIIGASLGGPVTGKNTSPLMDYVDNLLDLEAFETMCLTADVAFSAAATVADYAVISLLTSDTQKDTSLLSKAHERAASRLLSAARRHGGLLCKFGQHVSTLRHAAPPEYVRILSALTDSQPPSPWRRVKKLLREELGNGLNEDVIFQTFDKEPIASASVAQVHRAILRDGRSVAVKIMHPGLERRVAANFQALKLGFFVARCVFPSVAQDWAWLLPEFEDALQLELDLVQEAVNATRAKRAIHFSRDFCGAAKSLHDVDVPSVVWDCTTRRVVTTEFIEDAHRVDDLAAHVEAGLDPKSVASALVAALSTLSYEHGLVHADPHGGNVLVQKLEKKGRFKLWILDHGLYRRLDPSVRRDLCALWEALACRDFDVASNAAARLKLGEDATSALPVARLLFTATTEKSSSKPLGESPTNGTTRADVAAEVRKRLPNGAADASKLLQRVPRDLLFTLRSSSLLRGQHAALGGKRRDRYLAFATAAARGLCVPETLVDNDSEFLDALFPEDVADALRGGGASVNARRRRPACVARPHHPVNRPTSSERWATALAAPISAAAPPPSRHHKVSSFSHPLPDIRVALSPAGVGLFVRRWWAAWRRALYHLRVVCRVASLVARISLAEFLLRLRAALVFYAAAT